MRRFDKRGYLIRVWRSDGKKKKSTLLQSWLYYYRFLEDKAAAVNVVGRLVIYIYHAW